jgi:hypothetical protein
MTTTAHTTRRSHQTRTDGSAVRGPAVALGRRFSGRHVLVGAILVIAAALAFYLTAVRIDERTAVLTVAAAVPAGHVLTEADLSVARIVPDPAVPVVPADQRSSVVGRTTALPLSQGALLAPAALGPAEWPPAGESVIGVPVKAGRAPAGITAGVHVTAVVLPAASTTGQPAGEMVQARAVVVAAGEPDATGAVAVSLLMTRADALRLVGTAGEVALILQGGDG